MLSEYDHQIRRERMVREVIAAPCETERIAVRDQVVLKALCSVPRHHFVSPELAGRSYEDGPLPIGCGQTISQPYMVAIMTELLRLTLEDIVLEVGTGSGYQTAILAEIVKHVYTVEIVRDFEMKVKARLTNLGYTNVSMRVGDGYQGWKEYAPYDAIIVTAAPDHIPPALIEQMKPGARMVLPVGPRSQVQSLTLVTKDGDGSIEQQTVMRACFVPLTGKHS